MPVLVGLFVTDAEPAQADQLWARLRRGLGPVLADAASGSFRASVHAHHVGERALCPRGAAPEEVAIGFGGDGENLAGELLPPWLCCRYQPHTRRLRVETDRYGFALLYIRRFEGMVAFCTSATALGRVPPALERDPVAVAELVAFDHLLGERTLRRGVSALPQGHLLEIGPEGAATRAAFRYADLPRRDDVSPRAISRTLVEAFVDGVATSLRQAGGEPVVVPLSGGLDSRMLAAAAAAVGASVDAFTFTRRGEEEQLPDAAIAHEVARRLGLCWRRLELGDDWLAEHAAQAAALTDGQLDIVHSYGVGLGAAFSAGRLRLDGLAGDVVLGGSFLDVGLIAETHERRLEALWRSRSRLDSPRWQELLLPEARSTLRAAARDSLATSIDGDAPGARPDPRWSDAWILRHRIRRFARQGALLWEPVSRSVFPFFAPRFFDPLWSVPPAMRVDARLQREVYHRGWPRLAEVPWQKTGRPLPPPGALGLFARALQRRPRFAPQVPFYDFDVAFASSPRLRSWVRDTVLDPSAAAALEGFDRAALELLLQRMAAGTEKGMARLGVLLTLVLAERVWSAEAGPVT